MTDPNRPRVVPTPGGPYKPLFVEVPRELAPPRFGVLDMTALGPMFRRLYGR